MDSFNIVSIHDLDFNLVAAGSNELFIWRQCQGTNWQSKPYKDLFEVIVVSVGDSVFADGAVFCSENCIVILPGSASLTCHYRDLLLHKLLLEYHREHDQSCQVLHRRSS